MDDDNDDNIVKFPGKLPPEEEGILACPDCASPFWLLYEETGRVCAYCAWEMDTPEGEGDDE
jgi:hypothetical protein